MARTPLPPLEAGWLIVDGLPLYHRASEQAGEKAPAMVHVHGFGISGTYLEPAAALLATSHRTYIPDLPGMGRSMRPPRAHDLPALARSVIAYCDAVGVERATFVGNSLGCPIICEIATAYPERIDRAVLVSPAGGPNNQPLPRAVGQLMLDSTREPLGMLPIAVRDYLRFGLVQGFRLFGAMTRYPTLERVRAMAVPTLVVAGERDPLVNRRRAWVLASLPDVEVVIVPGAHALNFSHPELLAALVGAYLRDEPLDQSAELAAVQVILETRAHGSGPRPPGA